MSINIVDRSGEPRSMQELELARDAVQKGLITFTNFSPLFIHFTVILDALNELIAMRKLLEQRKNEKE